MCIWVLFDNMVKNGKICFFKVLSRLRKGQNGFEDQKSTNRDGGITGFSGFSQKYHAYGRGLVQISPKGISKRVQDGQKNIKNLRKLKSNIYFKGISFWIKNNS